MKIRNGAKNKDSFAHCLLSIIDVGCSFGYIRSRSGKPVDCGARALTRVAILGWSREYKLRGGPARKETVWGPRPGTLGRSFSSVRRWSCMRRKSLFEATAQFILLFSTVNNSGTYTVDMLPYTLHLLRRKTSQCLVPY